MKFKLFVLALFVAAGSQFAPFALAAEVDGSEVDRQLVERGAKIDKLALEEQLKLRAAQVKATEDPAVKAALEKRQQAIEEFRKALHDSMVAADPTIKPILDKIAVGTSPGF